MLEPALLFVVFFGPLAFGCVETWSLAILQAVLLSLPLLARFRSARQPLTPPWTLLIAVGAMLAVGALQALNPAPLNGPLPWLPFTASAGHTKKALLLWASYGALVWFSPRAFGDPRAAKRFAWAVVLIGFSVAVIGLIQAAQGNRFVLGFRPVGYGRSPFGPYYNNAHAASLFSLSALMGLGLLGSQAARTFSRNSVESRVDAVARHVLLAFLIGVILLGLAATRNRGAVLAFGGASLIVGLLSCGLVKKPSMRWGARAGILLLFLTAAGAAGKFGLMARGNQSSIPIRLSMYQGGLKLIADVPLWGAGLGTAVAVFEPYKEPLVVGLVDHVHNDWLELPMQVGIPAAILSFAALVVFAWQIHAAWKRDASTERKFIIGGGIAAALCFSLHAMVEFTWHIPSNAVIFLLVLSWLWSQTAADQTLSARHSEGAR